MRNRISISLIIFSLFSIIHSIKADELNKNGRYWKGKITKIFEVQKNGHLIMKDIRGDVDINTWQKMQVQIDEIKQMDIFSKSEAESAMEAAKSNYQQTDNTIEMGGPGFNRRWIQSHFKIWIPIEFNCDIETEGGDVRIEALKGNVKTSTGGGDIRINKIDGMIDVITGGGDIEISSATQEVKVKTGGGDIEISIIKGPVHVITGGGDVTVIDTDNDIDVRTGGGDIDIQKTKGSIDAKTGGGDITIVETNGSVSLSTGGGDITLRNITGNCATQTGGGDIFGDNIKGNGDMKTGAGDIDLKEYSGDIQITSGSGDVSIKMITSNQVNSHSVAIRTGYGNINLSIPENTCSEIHAKVPENFEISSDFPLTITSQKKFGNNYIQATGNINKGGKLIQLETGGGNVYLYKSE